MTAADQSASEMKARLDFMGIDADGRKVLLSLKPLIHSAVGSALSAFYEKIRKVPETRKFFADDKHMQHAKEKQSQHWDVIASGEFGAEYLKRVRAVGGAHARLGLEPRWYIGGYALVAEQLIHAVVGKLWPKSFGFRASGSEKLAASISILMKATFLDMELAISIYLEALEARRLEAEQARLEKEKHQSTAVAAMSAALERLANGDLTVQITQELSPDFDLLKTNFNRSLEKLRATVGGVTASASTISNGSKEISAASDDLSRRTEQTAASLEQTAAALDEITATIKKASEGANHASTVVAAARADAQNSGDIVRSAVGAMHDIQKSSNKITEIIGVIDEIAFQTNLLALNAGVEAARAGDAGRGFAVVASEVRALAQRAASAAKEIKALILEATSHVESGVSLVGKTGASLERIISQVNEINSIVGDIAAGAKEQAVGLQEVNTAVNQMDQTTQQNAAMVEETTAASHSLSKEVTELSRLVGQFNIHSPGSEPQMLIPAVRAQKLPAARLITKSAPKRISKSAKVVNGTPVRDEPEDWKEF